VKENSVTQTTKRAARFLVGAGIILALTGPASAAETWSAFARISYIEAGWVQDSMAVFHGAPLVNPNNCAATTAGYASDPADPGHSLFHTVALAAFLNNKEVHLLISGCVFSKPKIIAIGIR
jgi:hypothetical protein